MAKAHAHASAAEQLDEGFVDDGVDLAEDGLRAIDAAIDESDAELARGEGIPLDLVLAEMRHNLRARG